MDYSRIKSELDRKNLSIRELCYKIDVTEQGLHQMIRNKSMKIEVLERISNALEVPVTYWFEKLSNARSAVSNKRMSTPLSGSKLSYEKIDSLTNNLNEMLKEMASR
jgi:transcriptional regulator with XRE-family HTH domain